MVQIFADTNHNKIVSDRIEWCDVFKGIMIVLVVVGHSTGKFNQYIYQFHMAAFFFISGFTSKIRNQSIFEEFIKKFYKLMIPFYSIAFTGVFAFWILEKVGRLNVISSTQFSIGLKEAMILLFSKGTVYCDWLGATWFLPVLFFATIIFKILAKLCKHDYILTIVSIFLFLYSMKMALANLEFHGLVLPGIAQAFMMFGYIARKVNNEKKSIWRLFVNILLVWLFWWLLFRIGYRNTVDWPVKHFNGASDLLLPVCGILFMLNISKLIGYSKYIKRLFVALGQNTMGIMCFHFIGFKIAYLILSMVGQMELTEVYRLTPPESVSNYWWFLISFIAILFSVLFWDFLNKFKCIRVFLGGESAGKVYNALINTKVGSASKGFYDFCASLLNKAITIPFDFLRKHKYYKAITMIGVVILMASTVIIAYDGGRIKATFPYRRSAVIFENGWFPQSDSENYCWIEKQAEFSVFLMEQDEIEIAGYIPDNIENMSYISIKLNDAEVYHQSVKNDQQIEIHADISECMKRYKMNTFKIETDGERIPGELEADQRNFSALISSILIY